MQKLSQSHVKNTLFFLACLALPYGVLQMVRHVYGWLNGVKAQWALSGFSWPIEILQYFIGSSAVALILATLFTLLEWYSTGRNRLVSTFRISFAKLLLNLGLFAVFLYFSQKAIAALGMEPILNSREHSLGLTASISLMLAYFFALDVLLYWVHRLEHTNSTLWYFHAIHHAEEDLSSVSSAFHPLSEVVRWALATVPLQFLMTVNIQDGMIIISFLAAVHYIQHSRAPFHFGWFGKIIGDNRFHFIHHSQQQKHYDKNFATHFPVIDMMFGTYLEPDTNTLPKTGLPDRKGASSAAEFLSGKLEKRKTR